MSYLSLQECNDIANTVTILPISSMTDEEISQYSFDCEKAKEYVVFLKKKAAILDKHAISKTFVMIHNTTKELIGYYSLCADTVKLTLDEKIDNGLKDVDFMSLPALKLGKLAINKGLSDEAKRKGYGSFVLDMVNSYAFELLELGIACRFVIVDADIEYDPNTPDFYLKNGFVRNLSKKQRPSDKTVSMRRDIFYEDLTDHKEP